MGSVCIILAEAADVHVQKVMQHMGDFKDWECVVLDSARALKDLSVNLHLDKGSHIWEGDFNGKPLASIRSIWYRRPSRPKAEYIDINPEMARLAEAEMRSVLDNFYRLVNCRILPHPTSDYEADFKLYQLHVAAAVGLKTPKTVVSNHESWIKFFSPDTNEFCIKALSAFHWWIDNNTEYALKSARITRADILEHAQDLHLCPMLIQEYVEKKYEWRVTIVGDSVFSCRLDSQRVRGAEEDWRQIDIALIPHEILPLPGDIVKKLLKYMEFFKLNFGAFDLIEQPDGTFVFLECNPNGQWLWIELLTDAPISKAIAQFLFHNEFRRG